MRVVARRDHVADVHVYVVVGVDLDAAARLVLRELLAAILLKLGLVGVAVVVQRRYLVDAEQRLLVGYVALGVGVEMDDRAVLQLARAGADQVVHAAVHRGQREVQKVGVHLVRIVRHWRQRKLHLAACAAHRQLAPVGLGQGLEAAVRVAEAVEGVAHRAIVRGGGEQAGQAHAPDERREHVSGLARDGQMPAAGIGDQPLSGQDAVPGAALARYGALRIAAGVVARLVDDAAVLAAVDERELPLGRGELGGARQLEGVLVAAERQIELEVLQLADVADLGVVDD